MRYSALFNLNTGGAEDIVLLSVQGCHFHCEDCSRQAAWDFDGGKEWDGETEKKLLEMIGRDSVSRIVVTGGEPLADLNIKTVQKLLNEIRVSFGEKKQIWLYTGYNWEDIFHGDTITFTGISLKQQRRDALSQCDIVIDGRYVKELHDESSPWVGSTNQRVINVKESIRRNTVVEDEK